MYVLNMSVLFSTLPFQEIELFCSQNDCGRFQIKMDQFEWAKISAFAYAFLFGHFKNNLIQSHYLPVCPVEKFSAIVVHQKGQKREGIKWLAYATPVYPSSSLRCPSTCILNLHAQS